MTKDSPTPAFDRLFERVSEIRKAMQGGARYEDICNMTGESWSTVRRFIREQITSAVLTFMVTGILRPPVAK